VSQSLPNQVNDFNLMKRFFNTMAILSQSLPNQVNDFNIPNVRLAGAPGPVSQSLPNQVNDFNQLKD